MKTGIALVAICACATGPSLGQAEDLESAIKQVVRATAAGDVEAISKSFSMNGMACGDGRLSHKALKAELSRSGSWLRGYFVEPAAWKLQNPYDRPLAELARANDVVWTVTKGAYGIMWVGFRSKAGQYSASFRFDLEGGRWVITGIQDYCA